MSNAKRTVLITGCSAGGMGAALAMAFDDAGLRVIATARNTSKLDFPKHPGVVKKALDVLSESSIRECVGTLSSLDILVNNAGAGLLFPVSDTSIAEAKEIYDLNVWAPFAMMQACLPLLIASKRGMIINHSSSSSVIALPFQSIYNSSKAALGSISDTVRLELETFNVKVVELKTGAVRTQFSNNVVESRKPRLPEGSIYEPAREQVEKVLRNEMFNGKGTEPDVWAKGVVSDVLKKNPPAQIYRGDSAWYARIIPMLPFGILNGALKKAVGFDVVEQLLRKQKSV